MKLTIIIPVYDNYSTMNLFYLVVIHNKSPFIIAIIFSFILELNIIFTNNYSFCYCCRPVLITNLLYSIKLLKVKYKTQVLTDFSIFSQVTKHYNSRCLSISHHFPKVTTSIFDWTLCNNKCFLLFITLKNKVYLL